MTWTVDFYEEQDGSAPVEEFLESLPGKHKAKAVAIVKLLEEKGMKLPFPYSSQARGRLRELRTQFAKDRIRILSFPDYRSWLPLRGRAPPVRQHTEVQPIRMAEER